MYIYMYAHTCVYIYIERERERERERWIYIHTYICIYNERWWCLRSCTRTDNAIYAMYVRVHMY